jgi:hypothetical protein
LAQLLNMPAPGQTAAPGQDPGASQVAGGAPARPPVQMLGRPPGQTIGQLGQPGPMNAAQPGLAQGLMPDMPRVTLPTDKH